MNLVKALLWKNKSGGRSLAHVALPPLFRTSSGPSSTRKTLPCPLPLRFDSFDLLHDLPVIQFE